MCEAELETKDGENACPTVIFDIKRNQILTANRTGLITSWNASTWKPVSEIHVLELYKKVHPLPDKPPKSSTATALPSTKETSNVGKNLRRKPSFFGRSKEPINPIDIPGKHR